MDLHKHAFAAKDIHLSVNPESVRWVEELLVDLRTCTGAARALPSGQLAPRIREAFGGMRPEDLNEEVFQGILAMAGIRGGGLPGRMAEINEVLNALPVPLRERLLVEYLNGLFRQPGRAR
jgi:sphinganine-1-phosphate aldolase